MLRFILQFFFRNRADDSLSDTIVDFGENDDVKQQDKAYVKGGNIAYHPELINELKQEHQELLSLFTKLVKSTGIGEKTEIRNLLDTLKRRLVSHVLKENVQFYVYVKYLLAADPINSELAIIMQKDMSEIGKTVLTFISKAMEESALYDSGFQKELGQIGKILTERIKIEEERLYGLYVHPDAI